MKKLVSVLCFMLAFCAVLSPACSAEEENYDTLPSWNVRITVPEEATAVLKGSEYYIYAQEEDSIPYVMLRTYQYDDVLAFLDDFTAFMKEQYSDLRITADVTDKTIGDKKCFEIDYGYLVSGYEVKDRRIVIGFDGTVYMFASKEIEELGLTIGNMLDDVVAECEFISGDDTGQSSGLAAGYLYCQENGMPKYWLDFTGSVTDDLVLHCFFRSGDMTFYETCFVLDLPTAIVSENGLKICQVSDLNDADCSDWFRELTLQFYRDAAVMTVERDKRLPEEDTENTILSGAYVMVPVGVSTDDPEKQVHFCPLEEGPYLPEELGLWAKFYYFRNTGVFPATAEVVENQNETVTIHLYGNEDTDDLAKSETSEWYTVDLFGEGKNDITEEQISLMR